MGVAVGFRRRVRPPLMQNFGVAMETERERESFEEIFIVCCLLGLQSHLMIWGGIDEREKWLCEEFGWGGGWA